jgi:protein-tyrosine phosphatase
MPPHPAPPKRLLFICTGNFYRSRFAEAVFNHLAQERGLGWWAFSRGLAIHWAEGFISEHTRQALADRGIDLRHTGAGRVQLSEEDLQSADLIIALKDEEHRPMLTCLFPAWTSKVVFWDVSDLPHSPEVALPAIEREVRHLVDKLARADALPAASENKSL